MKLKTSAIRRHVTRNSTIKEMLLTTIATTLSIVLTFGSGQWIENWKERRDGRQMAMMVISDIDENVTAFKELAKWEEEHYELARYVERYLDQIEQVPEDTLLEAFQYLIEGDIYMIDGSKERIFNSSQQTWKNIDNALFISIVQSFYQSRRFYDEQIENDIGFRFPISNEERYQAMMNADEWNAATIAAALKEWLPSRKVKLFLNLSPSRSRIFYSKANDWQQKSDQCKFIMSITDEELEEYLNKQKRTGNRVSEKQLLGTWSTPSAAGNSEEVIEFMGDHRFRHLYQYYASATSYIGRLKYTRVMEGTWQLEGDSLIRDYDGDVRSLDRNGIECLPETKDSVETLIAAQIEEMNRWNEKVKREGASMGRRTNTAFIDRSGCKIELGKTTVNEDGEEETTTSYMVKTKQ